MFVDRLENVINPCEHPVSDLSGKEYQINIILFYLELFKMSWSKFPVNITVLHSVQ